MRIYIRSTRTLLVCVLAGIALFSCNTFRLADNDMQDGGLLANQVADNAGNETGYRNGYPYTITANAKRGGSITPEGSTSVPGGSSQTFIATADKGYRVADFRINGWSMGALPDLFNDDSSSYTFDYVTADHKISVFFDPIEKHLKHGQRSSVLP
jgi:hypothetical protein